MLLNLNSIDHQIHNYGNTSLTNANVNDDSGKFNCIINKLNKDFLRLWRPFLAGIKGEGEIFLKGLLIILI